MPIRPRPADFEHAIDWVTYLDEAGPYRDRAVADMKAIAESDAPDANAARALLFASGYYRQ